MEDEAPPDLESLIKDEVEYVTRTVAAHYRSMGSAGSPPAPEWIAAEIAKAVSKILKVISVAGTPGMVLIPIPSMAPFGDPLDEPEFVQEVWDTFVKPDQDSGGPQSVEMRMLMAILRAVYRGLEDRKAAQ